MKKIILNTFALSFCSIASFAQTVFEVKDMNTNVIVTNSINISSSTTANNQTSNDFDIKNISATTQTLTVRRYDDLLNTVGSGDAAAASFCTGSNCFTPATMVNSFTLAPNATMVLKADIQEATVVGASDVRYKVYDADNTTDAVMFTIKYNAPVGVKNISSVITNISDVFPNPSSSKAFINITAAVNYENVKISIINSLGSVVSVKNTDVSIGKNTIALETENLSTGLYFVSIVQGNQRITKKITITK